MIKERDESYTLTNQVNKKEKKLNVNKPEYSNYIKEKRKKKKRKRKEKK